MVNRSVTVSATGDVAAAVEGGVLCSACLTAGADAATAVLKSGGASGTVILKLAAAAGTTASHTFMAPVSYVAALHATLTGTAPVLALEI